MGIVRCSLEFLNRNCLDQQGRSMKLVTWEHQDLCIDMHQQEMDTYFERVRATLKLQNFR